MIPATPKQINFIKKLAHDHKLPNGVNGERFLDVLGGKFVSKSEASLVIDALLAQPSRLESKRTKAYIRAGGKL